MLTSKNVAQNLFDAYGFNVSSITEPSELEDGEVRFLECPNHHLQVGNGVVRVVRENKDGTLTFFMYAKKLSELKRDLESY